MKEFTTLSKVLSTEIKQVFWDQKEIVLAVDPAKPWTTENVFDVYANVPDQVMTALGNSINSLRVGIMDRVSNDVVYPTRDEEDLLLRLNSSLLHKALSYSVFDFRLKGQAYTAFVTLEPVILYEKEVGEPKEITEVWPLNATYGNSDRFLSLQDCAGGSKSFPGFKVIVRVLRIKDFADYLAAGSSVFYASYFIHDVQTLQPKVVSLQDRRQVYNTSPDDQRYSYYSHNSLSGELASLITKDITRRALLSSEVLFPIEG